MKIEKYAGIKYYVGSNAKENWELLDIMKLNNENYVWFHLNSFTSPYVIMLATLDTIKSIHDNSGNIIPENEFLIYGGELCRRYSKYKFMSDIKIMYVPIKKLIKSDKLGSVSVSGKSKTITLK